MRVLTHVGGDVTERLREALPEVEFVEIPLEGELEDGLTGDVLFTLAWGSHNLPEVLEREVRWVHTLGTGVDRFPLDAIGDQILTCSRGASAVPISEWVLAVMLAYEKRLPESWIFDVPEHWHYAELGGLYGRTLGIVGLGGIGSAVADRALAFGMHVVGFRRTAAPAPRSEIEVATFLPDVLSQADHLVLCAPATEETKHMIDAEAFASMKPGVHLVNIARGSLIDQDALRDAFDDGIVATASLDTVDPEPLPEGHWIYMHPRVRLSPHISWSMPGSTDLLVQTFVDNLHRYLVDQPLEGVVDLEAGY
jgi:phosphoglycerate dehydrogenase-like enzyme